MQRRRALTPLLVLRQIFSGSQMTGENLVPAGVTVEELRAPAVLTD